MNVVVRYFAAAAEASGRDDEQLEIAEGATLGDLSALLQERYGASMSAVLRSGSFLLDGVVRKDTAFPLADRVDILPPFAGG